MNIYQATILDVEGISHLFNSYRVFYRQDSNQEEAKAFILKRFQQKDSVIFVAVHQGNYLGFTQMYPLFSSVAMNKLWILNDLYVLESARKQGVASNLLKIAKEYAQSTGAKGIKLETEINNTSAQKLYEINGYEKDNVNFYYSLDVKTKTVK
ncbi:GNAT family N-acetyltransferase [Peribacillus frigoritolerans]|uniref:GNAT family N-acetyltransferase n=1 Tax=Peribacillus frigoritolerans TaxID=450367 RepID=UPI00207981E9|nr:GNAT family N-acetyltransferase [Peribacillus frigoritolerans]USK82547.1 GNAT family N-acetyltransferase [Peribacillus frigoritolerans]